MSEFLLLRKYPSLIPSFNLKNWNGIIFVENEEVSVTISTPYFPSIKNFSLIGPVTSEKNIKLKIEQFKKSAAENVELLQLLEFLRCSDNSKCKGASVSDDVLTMQMTYNVYNEVLRELRQLSGESVISCNLDILEVSLRTLDMAGEEHRLVLSLPHDYPSRQPVVVDADLPQVAVIELCEATHIIGMFKIFQRLVESFQNFWSVYESLTKNTWITDPEHPTFKDTHCRIIIGDNVSMLVTLNPQDVNTCPDIKFLGPEVAVAPFINSMETKLKTDGWNEDISMVDNLLFLLDLPQFPLPSDVSDEQQQQQQGECLICFAVRLEDQSLASRVCNNPKCNTNFHIACLAQWFQAVPTNETTFNLISGDCPACGQKILCPMKLS